MPDYPDISPDELKVFLDEAESLLESLDEHVVRLEQEGPDDELVREIFRVAHTLKGSSGMLGFEAMARLTHSMEDTLDRVRKGTLAVSEEMIDALLMSLDGLRGLKDRIATGADIPVDVDSIIAALVAIAEGGAPSAAQAAAGSRPVGAVLAGDGAAGERIHAAVMAGRVLRMVRTEFAPDSEWIAVRCFQVMNELERFGEVLASSPTPAEIDAEAVGVTLEAVVALNSDTTDALMQGVLTAIDDVRLARITDVDVEALTRAAADAPVTASAAEAPSSKSEAPTSPRGDALQSSVRIEVTQLDAMMNMVGELVIDRTRVAQLTRVLGERFSDDDQVRALSETAQHIEKIVDSLHERMMQARMLPVGLLFSKFPRLVRDLSRSLNKQIRLEIEGEDTEIDRSVIEQIKDPLVHLIRNACDHGIETPEAREAAGKPAQSTLRLVARHEQGQIVIALIDDGRGVDAERVKAKAIERGLISPEKAERLTFQECVELIFEPGLSTAAQTTEVSGRGVGMDIVRRDIESLSGHIEVESHPGEGTTFRMRLPLTLATFRGLLVGCGRTTYAIPLTYVRETLRANADEMHMVGGRQVMHLRARDAVLPVIWLDEVLGRSERGADLRNPSYVVVVRASDSESERPMAVAVDRLIDQQDIVVKSLGGFLGRTHGVAGASILGDGQVVLILDIPTLIKSSQQDEHAAGEAVLERIAS